MKTFLALFVADVYSFQLHHYTERSILLAVEHFRLVSRIQERTVGRDFFTYQNERYVLYLAVLIFKFVIFGQHYSIEASNLWFVV